MSERTYGVASIDELDSYPIANQDGLTWRPVRRRFDIQAFGVNAYTAEEAGQRVVEEHREEDGHEELYVVIGGPRDASRSTATSTTRRSGTLVHCPPGTLRSAIAAEPGTTVLGIGAKPGEVFQPSGWEWSFAGLLAPGRGRRRRRARRARGRHRRPTRTPGRATTTTPASRCGSGTRTPPSTGSSVRPRLDPERGREVRARRRGLRGGARRPAVPSDHRAGARQRRRARSAGTGSASGRATSSTAP